MIAYVDCFSGISGDMCLGACIDLGVPADWLKRSLQGLVIDDFDLEISRVSRHGIGAVHVVVRVEDHHHHRHFSDIVSIIEKSPLSERAKKQSIAVFDRIATAEAQIHGCEKATVHFHEVGGMDAIIDIVGTVLCMEYLTIDRIVASPVPLGRGFVGCQHGMLPVPAPATAAILKGVPVYGADLPCELVTPTGAGLLRTLADGFGPIPEMHIEKIGYGAGTREMAQQPNLLRIFVGAAVPEAFQTDRLVVVEASIDDMNPELYGFLMDRLFEDGAVDVCWIPIYMKKNRPGTLAQVLCPLPSKDRVIRRILSETTTLGIRYHDVQRRMLPRQVIEVDTAAYGTVTVKQVRYPDGKLKRIPEYEACKAIALEKGLALREVYETLFRVLQDGAHGRGGLNP